MPPENLIVDERFDVAPGSRLEIAGPFALLRMEPAVDARAGVRVTLPGGGSPENAQALARRVNFRVRRSGGVIRIEAESLPFRRAGETVPVRPLLCVALTLPVALHVDIRTTATEIVGHDLEGGFTIAVTAGSLRLERMRGELHVKSCRGPVILREFDGVGVTMRCTGGALHAAHLRAGRVSVEMIGGWAHLSGLNGTMSLSVSGGLAEVEAVHGPLDADVAGGRLTLRLAQIDETRLRCCGGGIDLFLPEAAAARIALTGGLLYMDERLEFTGERGNGAIAGRLGEGGPLITGTAAAGTLRCVAGT
jgi:hypothetical protein